MTYAFFIVLHVFIFLLFITYCIILINIGLKYFTYKDIYKLIFPFYIYLYIKRFNSPYKMMHNIILKIHLLSLIIFVIYLIYRFIFRYTA